MILTSKHMNSKITTWWQATDRDRCLRGTKESQEHQTLKTRRFLHQEKRKQKDDLWHLCKKHREDTIQNTPWHYKPQTIPTLSTSQTQRHNPKSTKKTLMMISNPKWGRNLITTQNPDDFARQNLKTQVLVDLNRRWDHRTKTKHTKPNLQATTEMTMTFT